MYIWGGRVVHLGGRNPGSGSKFDNDWNVRGSVRDGGLPRPAVVAMEASVGHPDDCDRANVLCGLLQSYHGSDEHERHPECYHGTAIAFRGVAYDCVHVQSQDYGRVRQWNVSVVFVGRIC